MATDTCSSCGLPNELCVCEDMSRSMTEIEVDIKPTPKGSDMTRLTGFEDSQDVDELASELKGTFGCGGGPTDDATAIELQGDHRGERLINKLEDENFEVTLLEEAS